jgi:hypothetical protein
MLNYKFLISVLIILTIVLTYFFIYPGIFIINTKDLIGYWSDKLGNIYNIKPINSNLNKFKKKIMIINGDNITKGSINGTIFGGGVNINGIIGNYYAKNRSIIFNNSDNNIWYKQ